MPPKPLRPATRSMQHFPDYYQGRRGSHDGLAHAKSGRQHREKFVALSGMASGEVAFVNDVIGWLVDGDELVAVEKYEADAGKSSGAGVTVGRLEIGHEVGMGWQVFEKADHLAGHLLDYRALNLEW